MSEDVVDKKKNLGLVRKTLTVTAIVFGIVIFFMVLRIITGESCGVQTFSDYDGSGLTESAYALTTANGYILMHIPYDHNGRYVHTYFCFTANATQSVALEIISLDHTYETIVIGDEYASHCYKIQVEENDTFNYVGLRCPTCSAADPKVYLYQGLIGEDVEIVYDNGNTNEVEGKSFDWSIRAYNSCWSGIKFFSLGYLTLLFFLLAIVATVVGADKLWEVLKDDW